jgi:DNA-binding NarL/FixJ family response regulator
MTGKAAVAARESVCRATHAASGTGFLNRRILVVDRSDIVLAGFRTLLERQPWVRRCMIATDGPTALVYAEHFVPHVVLLDSTLLELGGPLPGQFLARAPSARVLLATHTGRLSSATTHDIGGSGWVAKDWPARDLVHAVRLAANGRRVPTPPRGHDVDLSERERQVLSLMAAGATNREIGEQLYLSPHTVKTHSCSVYRKLEARNRAEAVIKAQRFGLMR